MPFTIEDKLFFVYVDFTEDDGRPFYVGKGTVARVKQRERGEHHDRVAQKHGCHREVILETPCEFEAFNREIRLIAELHTFVGDPHWNGIGTNHTVGGDGKAGATPSPETREKMAAAQRGRVFSDDHKAHLAAAREIAVREGRRSWSWSDEAKAAMSAARRGTSLSRDHCERISSALKGKKRPDLADKARGRKHSEETKAKMRDAHLGKKRSSEHTRKIMETRGKKGIPLPTFAGKRHSDETREKLRAAWKRRRERAAVTGDVDAVSH